MTRAMGKSCLLLSTMQSRDSFRFLTFGLTFTQIGMGDVLVSESLQSSNHRNRKVKLNFQCNYIFKHLNFFPSPFVSLFESFVIVYLFQIDIVPFFAHNYIRRERRNLRKIKN